eukprot:gene33741-45185_t
MTKNRRNIRWSMSLLATTMLTASGGAAFAQTGSDNQLDEVVVTASKAGIMPARKMIVCHTTPIRVPSWMRRIS